ncbi:MAG: S8 family serine peptidase [Caldilineaceae bacterium]
MLCSSFVAALAQDQGDGTNANKQLFLPLLSSSAPSGSEVDASEPFGGKTNQLIVRYKPSTQAASADHASQVAELSDAAGMDLTFTREMSGDALVLGMPRWMSMAEANEVANLLLSVADVDYAEPDRILHTTVTPNDPSYTQQWHYFAPVPGAYGANLPGAWDITTGSPNVVVAVIDTGILPHADLAGRTVQGYDFINDSRVANDGNGRDNNPADPGDWITSAESASGYFAGCTASNSSWHGTHVAGTIGANSNNGLGVTGINWQSKIEPLRVLGKCGGYTSDIADAIRWAAGLSVAGVPANANPAKVISMSLGGSGACDATSQSAISAAVAAGTVVVVAAGNSNADASAYSPASCNGVITVASTGPSGSRAYYSNYGATVEIAAPGGDKTNGTANGVLSTLNTGTTVPAADTYVFYQGTSMATPHVSGIVSLMFSVNPNLTPAQVTSLIQSNVTPFPSGSTCNTSICGPGIINAAAVVAAAQNAGSQPPAAFSKSSPANGGTVAGSSTTLSWSVSVGAASYEYCVNTTNSCTSWTSTGTATSVAISGLTAGTTYYWQARAINGNGTTEANGGAFWSFGVTSAPPPGAFNKSSPANNTTNVQTTTTLRWGSSSGATSYEVCIDATNNNSCDGTWTSMGTSLQATASGLARRTNYYWQVRARNTSGTTDANTGTWWRFTTR